MRFLQLCQKLVMHYDYFSLLTFVLISLNVKYKIFKLTYLKRLRYNQEICVVNFLTYIVQHFRD